MNVIFRILVFVVFIGIVSIRAQVSSVIHQGLYNGKNIYIQNPFTSNGDSFCITKVMVNDQPIIGDSIISSAFEIDFSNLKLKIGDSITLIIYHKPDCLPKVLYPDIMINPKCTFQTKKIEIKNDTLFWITTNEQGKMTFIVEQYYWNKWNKVGSVDGIGINKENNYFFPITTISGENKFRVKQIDYSGKPCISSSSTIISNKPVIRIRVDIENKKIIFSDSTNYEIFAQKGTMLYKGFGKEIYLKRYNEELYFLNYGSLTGKEVILKATKKKTKIWQQ